MEKQICETFFVHVDTMNIPISISMTSSLGACVTTVYVAPSSTMRPWACQNVKAFLVEAGVEFKRLHIFSNVHLSEPDIK